MPQPIYMDWYPEDLEAAPGKGYFGATHHIVGLAPSPNRPAHRYNEPFGAKSYKLLKNILDQVGEETMYVTNLIKTPLTPGTQPGVWEIQYYLPTLFEELAHIGPPKRVLALGSIVADALCPGFTKLYDDHGSFFFNPTLQCHVVPTYHFAAAGRNPALYADIKRDVQRFFTLPDPQEPEFELAETPCVVLAWLRELPEGTQLVVDIETTGLARDADLLSIGFADASSDTDPLLWEWDPIDLTAKEENREYLKQALRIIRERKLKLVGHNLAFDLVRLCYQAGIPWFEPVEDTLLHAHTKGEPQLGLKHLTVKYTDRPGSRSFGSFEDLPYLAEDVLSTRELLQHFSRLPRTPVQDLLGRLVPVFANMENRGVYIDRELLGRLSVDAEERWLEQGARLAEYAGTMILWSSQLQAVEALIAAGVPLTETTIRGKYTVKESALLPFRKDYPIVDALLNYREGKKYIEFLESYRLWSHADSCLHPSIRLFGAETGRLSSRDPNIQQVTRTGPLKTLFTSRWSAGSIGLCDLAQAELRVAAFLSGDEALAEALMSGDVHVAIASQIYQVPPDQITPYQRKKSKGVTFGLLYGGSEKGLADRVGVPIHEVFEVTHGFYKLFSDLAEWIESVGEFGVNQRYITTPMGRFRNLQALYDLEGPNSVRRKAINTPIQGTASDLMLLVLDAFTREIRTRKLRTRPLFPVHDSLIMEIAAGEENAVAESLLNAFRSLNDCEPLTRLPLWGHLPIMGELKIGTSWATVESTNEHYDPGLEYEMSNLG